MEIIRKYLQQKLENKISVEFIEAKQLNMHFDVDSICCRTLRCQSMLKMSPPMP